MATRREFLGALAGAVGGALLGGAYAYHAFPRVVEKEIAKTVKAAWIYVGPIGDYGWSYAHNESRLHAENVFPTLKTTYVEAVAEARVGEVIDTLVGEGYEVIFTTSFGYMEPTADAASRYPDVIFEHCSGYKSGAAGNAPSNMGAYFAEFYQLYYLNGLAAGAMTETNKIGYVAAHYIPEVVRHIDAFVLGAQEAAQLLNKGPIECYVVELGEWYAPELARSAAESLVETNNVDVLAFTEDTPTVLQVAEEYQEAGKRVWSFSHYSPMKHYGPTAHLTGQLVDWGVMVEYILARIYAGVWKSEDLWWRIGDGIPYRWRLPVERSTAGQREGAVYLAELNLQIPETIRTLIKQRYEEMKELIFEPFTGPIRDKDGVLKVEEGRRMDHDELWSIDWFVEGIVVA